MIGRRVGAFDEITQPGDYYGPTDEINVAGDVIGRGVWFLLPIADPADPLRRRDHSSREAWVATRANGLHRVSEPPWVFRECPDGSLEIRESILYGAHDPEGAYFHGYLDEGHVWRTL